MRAAAAIATSPAAARRPPPPHVEGTVNMKLVGELKPETLQHDSTAGDLRVWRKKFESYYTVSNMHLSRLNVQKAHLLNCLDRELSLQLDSSIQVTTPVTGNGITYLSILTGIFEKKYPALLRRKNFFSMAQHAGQDKRAFAESVKIAANESDIAGMTLQDAMCLANLTGCRDTRLKEKISELKHPPWQPSTSLYTNTCTQRLRSPNLLLAAAQELTSRTTLAGEDKIIVMAGETCLTQRRSPDRS